LRLDVTDPTDVIRGLRYLRHYVGKDAAHGLLEIIDRQPWISDLERRVQHYGYRFPYRRPLPGKRRSVGPPQFLGPLPDWALDLVERFVRDGFLSDACNQLIVNEYQPGQGINPHVDYVPWFGETIFSLSLGSSCVMNFTQTGRRTPVSLLLEPESLLILQGEARYRWKHCIPARMTDVINGGKMQRQRRISLTFRTVIKASSDRDSPWLSICSRERE
jgi:alkylated DNA repair dioxygenase AlkB